MSNHRILFLQSNHRNTILLKLNKEILENKKALIIGGGPAGLTAAYEFLKHTDVKPIVFESSKYWGGISRTVDYKGNKIDIGGHRFFSKSDAVMKWWNEILPIYSELENVSLTYQNKTANVKIENNKASIDDSKVMLLRNRKSRIFYNNKFFDYPVSLSRNTIKNIGYFSTLLIGFSYLKAVLFPIKKEKSLEDFFINRFGKRLYQTFFKDYTEKVWGVSCHEISAEWGAQRIKGLSITTTILHFLKQLVKSNTIDINQKNIETSLIEYFLYPKFGPGQMWNEVASKIEHQGGDLTQNEKVVKINILDNTVQSVVVKNLMTNKEEEVFADYFISSMPVTELLASFSCAIPENVKEVASGLCYRDFITVGLLLKKMNHTVDDNWIYIQEPSVKVGRLQIFNNWSPYLVKDENTIWVGLEYFCNENDDLWNKSENELKELAVSEMIALGFINQSDMLDATVIKMPKTYPAYFGTYNRFDEIIKFTDTISNLFLIGRNGMHKYNNQDHSMLTAMQVVQNIKANDFDKSTIWKINTEQEFHEEK